MKPTTRLIRNLLALLLIALSFGCSSDALTREIERAAADPAERSEETFRRIEQIILDNPRQYSSLIDSDGHIITEKLQSTINSIGLAAGDDFVWDISQYCSALKGPLKLHLMLERSGSMTGYDSRTGSGNFKRALNEVLNRFPRSGGEPVILIVNDGVYPFKGDVGQFMRDKDIFKLTAGIGDASYTDFGRIFDHLLSDPKSENVYVLATDLIYSPRDASGLTPAKIFNEEESLVSDIFRRHPDKEVAIIRLNTDFKGKYFPYNSPNEGSEYSGRRPFFLLIAGSRAAMSEIFSRDEFSSFADFNSLPGFGGVYRMMREPLNPRYFTILPRRRDAEGRYTPVGASENNGVAHGITGAQPGVDGTLTFEVAADFSNAPVDNDYLLRKENYELAGGGAPVLKGVRKIESGDINVRNKRYLGRATHILTIGIDIPSIGRPLEIRLLNRVPDWVETGNSDNDSNMAAASFGKTTFGLASLMQGIYRAMYGTANTPAYMNMKIDIKK